MAFVAKDPHDGEVSIPMDEAATELKRALPKDHPLVRKVERCFELSRGVIEDHMDMVEDESRRDRPDFEGCLDSLVRLLDDWRRGIRDWDEVEPALADARVASDWIGA